MPPNNMLVLNRLTGLMLSGPSLMTNIGTINSILSSWESTSLQITVLVTAVLSFSCDILALSTLSSWIIQPDLFIDFPKYLVAYSFAKRLYSICIVYVTFLRFQISQGRQPTRSTASLMYTLVYALLSVATALSQYLAYSTNNWLSAPARDSFYFKYLYKSFNVAATSYYVLFAFYVDVRLVMMGSNNPMAKKLFRGLRIFHNHWVYLTHEVLFFVAFWVTDMWALVNSDITSSLYIEQALLSFMLFNGICLVQAISSIHQEEFNRRSDDVSYKLENPNVNNVASWTPMDNKQLPLAGPSQYTPSSGTINPIPPPPQMQTYVPANMPAINGPAQTSHMASMQTYIPMNIPAVSSPVQTSYMASVPVASPPSSLSSHQRRPAPPHPPPRLQSYSYSQSSHSSS